MNLSNSTKTLLFAIGCVLMPKVESLAEMDFEGSISLLYLDGSGSPDAPYSGGPASRDYEGLVPRLSLTYKLSDHFELNATYTDFGTLRTSWIGSQLPPLIGVGGRQVITPFEIEEEMESIGAYIRYGFDLAASGRLELGAGLERVSNQHNGWLTKKKEDWSYAFAASYEHSISSAFSLSLDFIQIEPPKKTLRMVGGSIIWKF